MPAERSRPARARPREAGPGRARSARARRPRRRVRNSPSRAVRPQAAELVAEPAGKPTSSCRSPWSTISAPSATRARSQATKLGCASSGHAPCQSGTTSSAGRTPRAAQSAHRRSTPSASAGVTSWIETSRLTIAGCPDRRRRCGRAPRPSRGPPRRSAGPAPPSDAEVAGQQALGAFGEGAGVAGGEHRPCARARPRSRPRHLDRRTGAAFRWPGPRARTARTSRSSTAPRRGRPRREDRPAASRSCWNGSQATRSLPGRRCSRRLAGPSPTSTSRAPVRRSTSRPCREQEVDFLLGRQPADVDGQRPFGQAVAATGLRRAARGGADGSGRGPRPSDTRTTRSTPARSSSRATKSEGASVARTMRPSRRTYRHASSAASRRTRPARARPGRDHARKVAVVEPRDREIHAPRRQVHQPRARTRCCRPRSGRVARAPRCGWWSGSRA